jgi:uncharacterized delta-60 repeat protein
VARSLRALVIVGSSLVVGILGLAPVAASAQPGSLDTSFGNGGVVETTTPVEGMATAAMAVEPNGQIVLAGFAHPDNTLYTVGVVTRYNEDGQLDTTFGTDGFTQIVGMEIEGVAVQADGDIDVAGFDGGGAGIEQLLPDGTPDPSFGTDGIFLSSDTLSGAWALAIQPNGDIVVVGGTSNDGNSGVLRLEPNGTPDPTFGTNGVAYVDFGYGSVPEAVALQPDGDIVLGGIITGTIEVWGLARLTPTGSLDDSFGTNGEIMGPPGAGDGPAIVTAIAIQPNGDILALASAFTSLLYRFTPSGAPDSTFGDDGVVDAPPSWEEVAPGALLLLPDGSIVLPVGTSGIGAMRYTATGAADDTFGTDGAAIAPGIGGETMSLGIQPDGTIVVGGLTSKGFVLAGFVSGLEPPQTSVTLNPATPNASNGWYTSPVGVSVSAVNASVTNCELDPATPPTTFADIPAGCPYLTPGALVSTNGSHTLYAASESSAGVTDTPVSVSFKIDTSPPTIQLSSPADHASYSAVLTLLLPVRVSYSCTDAVSGIASCTGTQPSGSILPTGLFDLGTHTFTVKATDNAGNTSTVTYTYTVGLL